MDLDNPVSPVSAEELKPCPFCGKAPMWIHHSTRFDGHRLMSLGCCDFRKTGLEDTLIAAWNRRAPAASSATPEGYTDEWIAEQFKRTVMLASDQNKPAGEILSEEEFMKVLRVFGNRVLMEFGDREGMHRAFSESYERDKAKRVAPEGYRLVPIEPTPEMLQAAWDMANQLWNTPEADDPLPGHQYRAMIAAAPLPPDQNCTIVPGYLRASPNGGERCEMSPLEPGPIPVEIFGELISVKLPPDPNAGND